MKFIKLFLVYVTLITLVIAQNDVSLMSDSSDSSSVMIRFFDDFKNGEKVRIDIVRFVERDTCMVFNSQLDRSTIHSLNELIFKFLKQEDIELIINFISRKKCLKIAFNFISPIYIDLNVFDNGEIKYRISDTLFLVD